MRPAPRLWLAGAAARRHFDATQLGAADRRRWAGILSAARRDEWMSSRALLAAHGREAAASSLTHSAGFAALASGPARMKVGVDLERVKKRDFGRLAGFGFDAREVAALARLPVRDQPGNFYLLWTLKEAAAKALNIGLWRALRECVFVRHASGWEASLPTRRAWRAWVYAPRRDLVLALVCVSGDGRLPRAPRCREWPGAAGRAAHWKVRARLGGPRAER